MGASFRAQTNTPAPFTFFSRLIPPTRSTCRLHSLSPTTIYQDLGWLSKPQIHSKVISRHFLSAVCFSRIKTFFVSHAKGESCENGRIAVEMRGKEGRGRKRFQCGKRYLSGVGSEQEMIELPCWKIAFLKRRKVSLCLMWNTLGLLTYCVSGKPC